MFVRYKLKPPEVLALGMDHSISVIVSALSSKGYDVKIEHTVDRSDGVLIGTKQMKYEDKTYDLNDATLITISTDKNIKFLEVVDYNQFHSMYESKTPGAF